MRGFKKVKDRITVGLAVNVCGTERLKPIVIHKYKRPRCFGNSFNPDIVVSYYYNKKAWMRSEVSVVLSFRLFYFSTHCDFLQVFTDWSKKVNEQFLSQQRNCVMLLDNASSHGVADTLLTKVGSLDAFKICSFFCHQTAHPLCSPWTRVSLLPLRPTTKVSWLVIWFSSTTLIPVRIYRHCRLRPILSRSVLFFYL